MIPKTLHYCWFGNNPKSELLERCMATWRQQLPDFNIKEWNEDNSPLEVAYCRDALAQGQWSRASNYVRLWSLYHEGGLYLDTDFEIIKPLAPLLNQPCFLGFQRQQEHIGWLNNALMGAIPEHPFLQKCMDKTVQIYQDTGEFVRQPLLTTQVLREMGLQHYGLQTLGDVTLYPTEYFYPYTWLETFSPDCIQANTYAVHHWAGSWL